MCVSPASTSPSHENLCARIEWVMNLVMPNVTPKAISMNSSGWFPESRISSSYAEAMSAIGIRVMRLELHTRRGQLGVVPARRL